MERKDLEQRLALAEKHVVLGAKHVGCQQEIVAQLEHDRHVRSLGEARRLLKQFRELLALQIEDRNRLLTELGRPVPSPEPDQD